MVNNAEPDMYPTTRCQICGQEVATIEVKVPNPDGPGTIEVVLPVQPAPYVVFIPARLKIDLPNPKSISNEEMLRKALQHKAFCQQAPSMAFLPHASCCIGDVPVLKTGGRLKMKEPPPSPPPRPIAVPPPKNKEPS